MDEPLEKSFIDEMSEELEKQLSEFELAKKERVHDATVVSDDGRKRWFGLKDCLKNYIEAINDRLSEPLLSYMEDEKGNGLDVRHELTDSDVKVCYPRSRVSRGVECDVECGFSCGDT